MILGKELEGDLRADLRKDSIGGEGETVLSHSYGIL